MVNHDHQRLNQIMLSLRQAISFVCALNNFEQLWTTQVCWSSFSSFFFLRRCNMNVWPSRSATTRCFKSWGLFAKGTQFAYIYIFIYIYNISYRSCIGWSEWLFRWIRCRNWRCPDQIEQWVAQDATLDQAWISTKRGLADLLILPTCDILWYHDAMLMQHSFRHWSERAGGWCDSS